MKKLNPGQTYEADTQTTQTMDQYGNVTQVQVYSFGWGSVGSLARTYTNFYLYQNNSAYVPYYIFNRLLASTVTDGTNSATLASNVYDGGTLASVTGAYEHDSTYGTSLIYRGNVTSSTTPTTITTNAYDMTGNVTTTTVNGVATTVTSSSSTNYAAPTQVTTIPQQSSNMTWNTFLGLSSAAGPNGDTGAITYDANARPLTSTSPYGALTYYTYNDSASTPNKVAMTDSHGVQTFMDGFGRTTQTNTGSGNNTSIATVVSTVNTLYAPCGCSPLGKMSQQSQPFAPGATPAYTTYHYDASGRTTSVVLPDNMSTTTYLYEGNTVIVTDPAGNQKSFTMDPFGNLFYVTETDPALGTVATSYSYDVLNHLTQVYMPRGTNHQIRTFNYNSANTVTGFLQSATYPEIAPGSVSYTYNTGTTNTLKSKTDAKNNTLAYAYDGYNRLTSVSVSGSAIRTYSYDTMPSSMDPTGQFLKYGSGRLTAIQYPTQPGDVQLNEMYSYTQAGPAAIKRIQANEPYTYQDELGHYHSTTLTANLDTSFGYNGEGGITSISYPSTVQLLAVTPGPSYNYSYDSMYRLSGMTDSNSNTIVNGVTYNAANQMLTMTTNGYIEETRTYNSLNQLATVNVLNNAYGPQENRTYNYPAGANNGKISSMYNAISGETITYAYDSLNRLATASDCALPSGCTQQQLQWGEQYGFDSFGNLLSKTPTAGSGPSLSQAVNAANQITNQSYDANGNTLSVTNNGLNYNLGYDAENRLSSATPNNETYIFYGYDGQNHRLWNWSGSTNTFGNATNYTINIFSPSGQNLASYTLTPGGQTSTQGITTPMMQVSGGSNGPYFGSRLLGTLDRLGSTVSNSPSVVDYFPWGEARGSANTANGWAFATYWYDTFTGLDYANNRYYSNIGGRFMTPDPYTASGGPADPQSWNQYSYTRGDPVNRYDPGGLQDEEPGSCDPSDPNCTGILYCPNGTPILIGGTCPNGAAPVVSNQRQPGQSAGNPNWGNTLLSLRTAEKTIQSATFSQQCLNDIHSIKNPDGSSLSTQQIREEAGSLTLVNGATSNDVVTLPLPNGQVFTGPVSQVFTPGNPNYQSGVKALTQTGTNTEYWAPNFSNGLNASYIAGSLMHEIIHNLGFGDTQIQSSIPGLTVSPYTSNISDKLATDCFGWTGN